MNSFVRLLSCVALVATSPLRYDQRQDGDLNIQAHLDKIVLLVVPQKNVNLLDYSVKIPYETYEDILPYLAKDTNGGGGMGDVRFDKIPVVVAKEVMERLTVAAAAHKSKDLQKSLTTAPSAKTEGKNMQSPSSPPSEVTILPKKGTGAFKTDGRTSYHMHDRNDSADKMETAITATTTGGAAVVIIEGQESKSEADKNEEISKKMKEAK